MSLEHDTHTANMYRCREHSGCWTNDARLGTGLHISTRRLAQDAARCKPGCPCWRHAALRWAYLNQFSSGGEVALW